MLFFTQQKVSHHRTFKTLNKNPVKYGNLGASLENSKSVVSVLPHFKIFQIKGRDVDPALLDMKKIQR